MQVQVLGADQLRRLARDCNRAGQGEVRKEMTKRLRNSIKPIVPELRAAIRALPGGDDSARSEKAKRERPRSLRDAAARGVQAKVSVAGPKAGARIRIDPRHFPDSQKTLPAYLDGSKPRWRHPTYGHSPWVMQRPHPYFDRTIRPHVPRVRQEMQQVLDDVARILKGAS